MKAVTTLGRPTWSCSDASGLCFIRDEFLGATDYSGQFFVFSSRIGRAAALWRKNDEQLNCVSHDGENTFFVGGSLGIVHSIVYQGGDTIEHRDEREVLPYIDLIEYSRMHALLAVVCDDQLRLILLEGLGGAIDLTLPSAIKSAQWSNQLDAFLVVCHESLYAVSPNGDIALILKPESRLLAAKYHGGSDSLTLLVGTSENGAKLQRLDRTTQAVTWEVPLVLDHQNFATIDEPREFDSGSVHILPATGGVVVSGLNWLAKYDSSGAIVGSQVKFPEMLNTIAVSSEGRIAAAMSGSAGLHVWEGGKRTPLHPRDCHYSPTTNLAFTKGDSLVASSNDYSSEVMCWHIHRTERLWVQSLGGYWCDGMFSDDKLEGDLQIAISTSGNTELVSVSSESGDVENRRSLNCGFRAHVARMPNGDLTLAPSWAYGPRGTAAIADFPSLNVVARLTAGDYGLAPVTADALAIIAADGFHFWRWDRRDPSHPSDIEIPVESFSGLNPILSLAPIDNSSFLAIAETGAFRFVGPMFQSEILAAFESSASSVSQPRENLIAVGFTDGHAELRSVPQFKLVHSWRAHNNSRVTSVAFAKNNTLIATGAGDGTISVWTYQA